MDSPVAQLVLAYMGTHLVELLKKWSGVPWMDATTDKINKMVGALVALCATAGILIATSWEPTTGTLDIHITGLTGWNVLKLGWDWLSQFVLQQALYHGTLKKTEVKS